MLNVIDKCLKSTFLWATLYILLQIWIQRESYYDKLIKAYERNYGPLPVKRKKDDSENSKKSPKKPKQEYLTFSNIQLYFMNLCLFKQLFLTVNIYVFEFIGHFDQFHD